MRSDIAQGDGMFKSTDGGRTWPPIGLADSQQIARIIVHPTNPRLVYVAALGHPYGRTPSAGSSARVTVARTWQKVLGPDADTGAMDVALRAREPARPLRRAVADAAHAVEHLPAVERPRQRPLHVHRRRRPLDALTSGLARASGARSVSRSHRRRRPASTRSSTPSRAADCIDRTIAARTGASDRRHSDLERGWYFGRHHGRPANPDRVCALNTIVLRSEDGGASFIAAQRRSDRRRFPRSVDRSAATPTGRSSAPIRARSSR